MYLPSRTMPLELGQDGDLVDDGYTEWENGENRRAIDTAAAL